jgi:hypothetical protein
MPNTCANRLAIHGPRDVVEDLVRVVASEDQMLDFERLIPTPGQVKDSVGDGAGGADWRGWRIANWGVKWNAWEVVRAGYGRTGRVRYRFRTAYAPPLPILDHIAARWPQVTMILSFEIEMLGEGQQLWRDGARINGASSERTRERPPPAGPTS